ncbi:MAG TPA: histidine phosphatase family protein [Catalimonadaceae bacterium]|nr:histidine phosphatase family protein [Catalimonadaceae bacterium]HPI10285.1 histidine phosphatase family protein [Catalimonadaceae bacterium]
MKKLYIIRHGETEPNRHHIIQGSGLDAPLNETGMQQAADFFMAYRHIPFDAVFTSALIRTWQSVDGFLRKGVPHYPVKNLNEISWGVKDGTRIDPSEQKIYNSMLSDWKAGLLDRSFDKGESPNMVASRMKLAVEDLLQTDFKTILMCIHGRALRILLCLLMKKSLTEMETFLHSNLCLYILSFDGQNWTIELENDTHHLQN